MADATPAPLRTIATIVVREPANPRAVRDVLAVPVGDRFAGYLMDAIARDDLDAHWTLYGPDGAVDLDPLVTTLTTSTEADLLRSLAGKPLSQRWEDDEAVYFALAKNIAAWMTAHGITDWPHNITWAVARREAERQEPAQPDTRPDGGPR